MALCPKCSENFMEGSGVLSKQDNKTEICPECGYKESVEYFEKKYVIEKTNKIIIEDILDELQIPINWAGYKLWIDIIEIYLQDTTKSMEQYYNELMQKYNKTRNQVERSLRIIIINKKEVIKTKFNIEYNLTNKSLLMLFAREVERRKENINASKIS